MQPVADRNHFSRKSLVDEIFSCLRRGLVSVPPFCTSAVRTAASALFRDETLHRSTPPSAVSERPKKKNKKNQRKSGKEKNLRADPRAVPQRDSTTQVRPAPFSHTGPNRTNQDGRPEPNLRATTSARNPPVPSRKSLSNISAEFCCKSRGVTRVVAKARAANTFPLRPLH